MLVLAVEVLETALWGNVPKEELVAQGGDELIACQCRLSAYSYRFWGGADEEHLPTIDRHNPIRRELTVYLACQSHDHRMPAL